LLKNRRKQTKIPPWYILFFITKINITLPYKYRLLHGIFIAYPLSAREPTGSRDDI